MDVSPLPPTLSREALSVLVLEDSHTLRPLIQRYLTQQGFTVQTANDMASARALLEENTYDVVIADIELPDGDGTDLLAHLPAHTRLITLSGFACIERDATYPRWVEHWSKPFPMDELVKSLDQIRWERAAETALPPRPDGAAKIETAGVPAIVPVILRESARLLVHGEISVSHFQANLQRLRDEELDPRGLSLTVTADGAWKMRYVIESKSGVHLTLECTS